MCLQMAELQGMMRMKGRMDGWMWLNEHDETTISEQYYIQESYPLRRLSK